jgi:hypothetical protein
MTSRTTTAVKLSRESKDMLAQLTEEHGQKREAFAATLAAAETDHQGLVAQRSAAAEAATTAADYDALMALDGDATRAAARVQFFRDALARHDATGADLRRRVEVDLAERAQADAREEMRVLVTKMLPYAEQLISLNKRWLEAYNLSGYYGPPLLLFQPQTVFPEVWLQQAQAFVQTPDPHVRVSGGD